MMKIKLKTIDR